MKVLFLDFDGVMNCYSSFDGKAAPETTWYGDGKLGSSAFCEGNTVLDTDMVKRVKAIVERTGCKIVISSTWRELFPLDVLITFMIDAGWGRESILPVIGKTPPSRRTSRSFRGDEINAWLKENPDVTHYVCLDDNQDFYPGQNLVLTNWYVGCADWDVERVVEILNRELEVKEDAGSETPEE